MADVQRMAAQAVSILKQQEALPGERFGRHLVGTGQRVGPVARKQELVLKDFLDGEIPGLGGQCDQYGVQLSVRQAGRGTRAVCSSFR